LDANLLLYGRRHGGSDARSSQEVDMAVARDPALPVKAALPVKTNNHRSQPKTYKQASTPASLRHPWNNGSAPLWTMGGLGLAEGADDQFVFVQRSFR
jgi:hypothetical protein